MEFDETPRFWYPRIALDAWIDFSSRTIELRPSECQENLIFCFSLPFLSLFISLSPSLLFSSPPFFLFFPFSLSYPPNFPSLVCSPSYFFFIFHFLFFLFSLIFSSLSFSLIFSFIFSFLSLFFIIINRMVPEWSKSGGNFPPLSSINTCLLHNVS